MCEWNEPSRLEHYVMQMTAEIPRVLAKNPGRIKASQFKIPFTFNYSRRTNGEDSEEKSPELVAEEATKIARSRWFAGLGKGIKTLTTAMVEKLKAEHLAKSGDKNDK